MTAVGGPSERIGRAPRRAVVGLVAMAVAALLAVGGCSSDGGPRVVAEGTYLLPPEGATEVSGATVGGASSVDFVFEGRAYELTQSRIAGGDLSAEDLGSAQADAGARPVEIDGVGTVQVFCGLPSAPDLPDGGPAPRVTGAWWVVDETVYGSLTARDDLTGETCGSGDLSASPLVATVAGVRSVDGAGWAAYVADHDIDEVEVPDGGPWYDDPVCATSGGARVCAEPAGAISLTAEGLEPGSTFSWSSVSQYPPEPVDGEVVVADDGELPGALGIMTFGRSSTTVTFSATTADGEPFTGTLKLS